MSADAWGFPRDAVLLDKAIDAAEAQIRAWNGSDETPVYLGANAELLAYNAITAAWPVIAAELQRLRAGAAEDLGDERCIPTPAQWVARFLAADGPLRLDRAWQALADRERAHACFVGDHESELERQRRYADAYRACYERVVGEREDAVAEVQRLQGRVATAEGVLRWLVALDEPGSPDRRTVSLAQIIDRARAALSPDSTDTEGAK